MQSLFEQMGGSYTLKDDGYYYPDLTSPKDAIVSFGRYSRLHKDYLKKHRSSVYSALLHLGRLYTYLTEIDTLAKEMLENLTRNMAQYKMLQMSSKLMTKWLGWVE